MPEENPPIQPTTPQIGVSMQYVKDFSFENPNAPRIYTPTQSPPEINMGVNVRTQPLAGNGPGSNHIVTLMLRLEAKLESQTAFIAELTYEGIFTLPAAPEEEVKLLLLVECPRLLFPFARAVIANAVREGGFPQIFIAPIDFAALYQANKDNIGAMVAKGAA